MLRKVKHKQEASRGTVPLLVLMGVTALGSEQKNRPCAYMKFIPKNKKKRRIIVAFCRKKGQ